MSNTVLTACQHYVNPIYKLNARVEKIFNFLTLVYSISTLTPSMWTHPVIPELKFTSEMVGALTRWHPSPQASTARGTGVLAWRRSWNRHRSETASFRCSSDRRRSWRTPWLRPERGSRDVLLRRLRMAQVREIIRNTERNIRHKNSIFMNSWTLVRGSIITGIVWHHLKTDQTLHETGLRPK